MPIAGVVQPEMRLIAENLRLKKLEGEDVAFAREWYLDPDILLPMDGAVNPYSLENIKGMYQYLRKHGELYIIEYLENGGHAVTRSSTAVISAVKPIPAARNAV